MARKPLPNYLRTQRKRWALSQTQLSLLLGYQGCVGKYEANTRLPSLRTALACEVIFGVPVGQIYAGIYSDVEEEVMRRAYALYETVENRTDPAGKRKCQLLREMLARATAPGSAKETNDKPKP